MLARGKDGLEGVRREVEKRSGQAIAIPTDVSQFEQVQAAADTTRREFGSIDLWINNAMISTYSPRDRSLRHFLGIAITPFERRLNSQLQAHRQTRHFSNLQSADGDIGTYSFLRLSGDRRANSTSDGAVLCCANWWFPEIDV